MSYEIGKKIKELREEKGMTLNMFVLYINEAIPEAKIDKSMVSRWENGINEPSLENAKNLSLFFDVSVDYLAGLTDDKTPLGTSSTKDWKKRQEEIRKKIRDLLIMCRKEKGITQRELARLVDSKPTTIASWEQGKSLPSIDMLYRLAKLYGKTMNYMYGEEQ